MRLKLQVDLEEPKLLMLILSCNFDNMWIYTQFWTYSYCHIVNVIIRFVSRIKTPMLQICRHYDVIAIPWPSSMKIIARFAQIYIYFDKVMDSNLGDQ